MTDVEAGPAPGVPEWVLRWAERPGAAAVLASAREQIEAGRSPGSGVRLTSGLSAAERDDVGRVLGLAWAAGATLPTMRQLCTALAAKDISVVDLLTVVGGPVRDRPAEKAAAAQRASDELCRVRSTLTGAGVPEQVADLALSRGWLGRRDQGETAAQLSRLLAAVPKEAVMLATLAGELFTNPHALDRDTGLGRAAQRVLAARQALLDRPGASADHLVGAADAAMTPAGRRSVWADVGVTCDRLSVTVLTLNVTLPGSGRLEGLLTAGTGEPLWLTERQLSGATGQPGSLTGVLVRICENPSVVETAADVLAQSAQPLVCTYGRPSTAARLLLDALASAGAGFLVSADRDQVGTSITTELLEHLPRCRPWLPEAVGLFEEERLAVMVDDLRCPDPEAPSRT